MLRLLGSGKTDEAATAYARYVLDVRDSFEICNAQINALRTYSEAMELSASVD